jgi:hypothetical protein
MPLKLNVEGLLCQISLVYEETVTCLTCCFGMNKCIIAGTFMAGEANL